MTKSKKILSLALALVMVLSVLSVSAFAAKTTPTGSISISADTAVVAAGETVTVTVTATASENYYVGPVSVPLTYDADLLEVTSVTPANIFGADTTEAVVKTDVAGEIKVVITPDTAGTPLAPNLNGTTLTLYTVVFTAKDNVNGTDTVAIVNNPKTEANSIGTLYMGSFDKADVRTAEVSEFGQTITLATASVDITVGAEAGDPELVLTDENNGAVIDRTSYCEVDGFVYGIDTDLGEAIEDYVTTEVGSIEVVENDEGAFSTGATILLKDASGDVVETYYFVFFGDINGDGFIDGTDVTLAEGTASYSDFDFEATDGTATGLAADTNGDEFVDGSDVTYVEGVASYADFPTQAETAEEVAAMRGAI